MRWHIEDFKGLKEGGLDLSPGALTLLAGANSSGKSSLIQSVLMAAQSLSQQGPTVLNGTLTRLGESKDLVRGGQGSIRATIEFEPGELRGRFSRDSLPVAAETHDAVFKLVPEGKKSSMKLDSFTLSRPSSPGNSLILSKHSSNQKDVQTVKTLIGIADCDVLHVKNFLGTERRIHRTYVAFQGLQPLSVIQLLDREKIEKSMLRELRSFYRQVKSLQSPSKNRNDIEVNPQRFLYHSYTLWELINDLQANKREQPEYTAVAEIFEGTLPDDVVPLITQRSEEEIERLFKTLSKVRADKENVSIYLESNLNSRMELRYGTIDILEQSFFRDNFDSIQSLGFLKRALETIPRRVNYLGPLRDEPRVVWNQWSGNMQGLPVGIKGEYSAEVLSRKSRSHVTACLPGEQRPSQVELGTAVDRWLSYLQIGEQAKANDQGKLGVGLTVMIDGHPRDLTSVGVGVSQALPLIVALLTTKPNGILFIEQPELHLHPGVQARLGDLILNARPDLCIVIESHSDSLLTRIRRRVAEGSCDPSRCNIAFIDSTSSGSIVRELRISQYGDLSEWPAGFFDSTDDFHAILAANAKRLNHED